MVEATPLDGGVLDLLGSVVTFLAPKPSSTKLMRVGGNSDGAYLVPQNMEGISACFSPGVANRKDFEDELLEKYGVRSHLLDASSDVEQFQTPLKEGLQTFRKEWLASKSSEGSISLDDWVEVTEPGDVGDLLLQMDIEGAEYDALLAASSSVLKRFRIAVIEFHNVHEMMTGTESNRERLRKTMAILDELFISVHVRANNCCRCDKIPGTEIRVPQVLEATLIRKDSTNNSSTLRKPRIPHPLDIPRNVESRMPVHLRGPWNEHSSLLLPALKIFSDWARFFFASPSRIPRWLSDKVYARLSPEKQGFLRRILFWSSRK